MEKIKKTFSKNIIQKLYQKYWDGLKNLEIYMWVKKEAK